MDMEEILQYIPSEGIYSGELYDKIYPDGPRWPDRRYNTNRNILAMRLDTLEMRGDIRITRAKRGGVNFIQRMV